MRDGPFEGVPFAAGQLAFEQRFAPLSPQMLAVHPRSIGMGDKFIINFMEAPMQTSNQALEAWTL